MLTTYALIILLYRPCQLTDFVTFPPFNNSYVFLLFSCFLLHVVTFPRLQRFARCHCLQTVTRGYVSRVYNEQLHVVTFPALTVTSCYFSRACKQSYFVTEAFPCEKGYEEEEEEGAGKDSSLISPSAPLLIFFGLAPICAQA